MTDGHPGSAEPGASASAIEAEVGRRGSVPQRVRSIEAAAVAGIAFAALAAVAISLLSSFPDLESDEQLTDWFSDTGNQTTMIIGCNLVAISSIMFLWFVAVIRRRLGDLEDRFFGTVFLGSALAYVATWMGYGAALAAPAAAMAHLDGATVTTSSATNSVGLGAAFLLMIGPRIQAVFVLVTSTLIMRSKVLPAWLAIVGYIAALGMLVLPLIAEPLGLGFPVWVFLVSVVILVVRPHPAGQ